MMWWGRPAVVETSERNGELIFRARRQHLAVNFVVQAGFCAFLVYSLTHRQIGASLFVGVAMAATVNEMLRPGSELRVTQVGLTASKPGRWIGSESSILWTQVTGMQYSGGGEDEPRGFYVSTGRWSQRCMLPNLDREQANEVIDTIYGRFPNLRLAAESPGLMSSLFGHPDEITVLGLTNKDQ